MIVTPRCKPLPMPDKVIKVVNQMGKDEGILDRIHFHNIFKESTLENMYGGVDSQDDSRYASHKSWDMLKDGGQIDQKNIVYDDTVDN